MKIHRLPFISERIIQCEWRDVDAIPGRRTTSHVQSCLCQRHRSWSSSSAVGKKKKKPVSSLLPLQLVAFHCDSWLKVIHVLVLLSKTYCSLEQWFLTTGSRPNFGHQHHLEGHKKNLWTTGLLRLSTEDTEICHPGQVLLLSTWWQ